MSSYEVKWKGRRSGPYSIDELRSKFESREIGGMHEVSVDEQWMTVRAFFRQNPPPSASVDVSSGNPNPAQQVVAGSVAQPLAEAFPGSYGAQEAATGLERTLPISREEERALIHHYYAGFWIRTMALLLDGLFLVWAPLWIYDYLQETSLLTFDTLRSLTVFQWSIVGLVCSAAGWFYFTLFESSPLQGSPGKRLVGLKVYQDNGSRIDIGTASLRNLAKVGSGLMLAVGFFLAVFTPRRQTFHDLVSHTVVSLNFSEASVFHVRN